MAASLVAALPETGKQTMLKRFFRHLFTTAATGRRAFPEQTLLTIEELIGQGEKTHRAEIRLIIEPSLSVESILSRLTARERALELFGRFRIWDTEENCGVLVYINMADRQVEVIADRGIACKVSSHEWENICGIMTSGFKEGNFQESTLKALSTLNHLLEKHFPLTGNRANQLPDHPVLL